MPTVSTEGIADGQPIYAAHPLSIINAVNSYMFKHIPITGDITDPTTVKIYSRPASETQVYINDQVTSIKAQGFTGNKDITPQLVAAADYSLFKYIPIIMKEQEEGVDMYFGNGEVPNVDTDGVMTLKFYRSNMGSGYNGGTDCYITLIIMKS
jgi:hypothetical protein